MSNAAEGTNDFYGRAENMTGLLGGAKAPTPAPVPEAPVVDNFAVQKAKKKSIFAQMQRSGRQSTILSDVSGKTDKLGG